MSAAVDAARRALAGRRAWLVGGVVRDEILGRPTADVDLVVEGDAESAARALREHARGAVFRLSDEFGAWRVVSADRTWHADLMALRDGDLLADLAARDFTINAMARPLAGGDLVDPHGGAGDLAARHLRMVAPAAFDADPLRALRAVRFAAELGLEVDPETLRAARERAARLDEVAVERIWAELRRVLAAPDPVAGIRLAEQAGVTAAVLPELLALRGVEQNPFHHRDVHDHTLEVLAGTVALERDPAPLGPAGAAAAERLGAPLADGVSRWTALRLGALLHDIAKPATRGERPDGRVTFIGHDSAGADMARAILRRLRAPERVVDHVAGLARHHLRAGFLVHDRPLTRRAVHRYLKACGPVATDVTVLSVADRLATRGRNAEAAITSHLEVAAELLAASLEPAPAQPLLRGDELARELGIEPGPRLGELLAHLEEDRYAGAVTSREEAVARARELLDTLRDP